MGIKVSGKAPRRVTIAAPIGGLAIVALGVLVSAQLAVLVFAAFALAGAIARIVTPENRAFVVRSRAVDVTVLTESGERHVTVEAGSVFVCPKGLWHRQLPRPAVTMLFGTPTRHGEVSMADDPRVG